MSEFSSGVRGGQVFLEGEVVVTTGRPWITAQALGGLHDPITIGGFIEVFPEQLQDHLLEHASNLNPANFCAELAQERHIEPAHPALTILPPAQQDAILGLDTLRNELPEVIRCDVSGDIATFHKQVTFRSGTVESRQSIYGAVRFLEKPYSSVQLVRITVDLPAEQLLTIMTSVVGSFQSIE